MRSSAIVTILASALLSITKRCHGFTALEKNVPISRYPLATQRRLAFGVTSTDPISQLTNNKQANEEAKQDASTVAEPQRTSDHRHRVPVLEKEIQLLQSLADSDDAVNQLKELWRTEKDPYINPVMLQRSVVPQDLRSMSKGQLQRQIRQHPKWVEPRVRLAELYYKERRTLAAFEQCLEVLEIKPWHFTANELLVRLSVQRRDLGMALTWARLRLPKLRKGGGQEGNWRREAWVDRAVTQAMEKLDELENDRERSMMATAGLVIPTDVWSR